MDDEVEIKIRVDDVDGTAARIDALGAVRVRERTFEDNRVYDFEGDALARQGKLLRLRVSGGRALVTVKAPAPGALASPFKMRREIETIVADPDAMAAALESVGFSQAWRYQKYRREWILGEAHIFLDEVPWGVWLEIEGEPERIEAITRSLGWGRERWERGSYRELHERHCAARGLPVGDMVFDGGGRA
jgi:adenylate cyclase class 2